MDLQNWHLALNLPFCKKNLVKLEDECFLVSFMSVVYQTY